MTNTYTVTGLINEITGRLLISGTYEGHLESVCDETPNGTAGYHRWAGTFEAESWQDAETQAHREYGGVWAAAGELRDGDRVVIAGDRRTVTGEVGILHHANGYSEAIMRFTGDTTWSGDASTQLMVL